MKILILGGTAFTGLEMVRRLTESGHEVTTYSNAPAPSKAAKHIIGERQDGTALKKIGAAKWDVLIDNLAFNAADMRLALEAFSEVGHYILHSTVSVYRYAGKSDTELLTEDAVEYLAHPKSEDLTDPHWSYARGKLEAERALAGQDSLSWTVLRAPVIYGPNDPSQRGFWYLARILDGGPILIAEDQPDPLRLAYSLDVAQAFVEVVESQKRGGTYNLPLSSRVSLQEFLLESAQALGKSVSLVKAPHHLLNESLRGPYAGMPDFNADVSRTALDFPELKTTPLPSFLNSTARWFSKHYDMLAKPLLKTRNSEILLAKSL